MLQKRRTRKRPKRKWVATGIYSDKYGISIPIRGKEHRYPQGTPTEELLLERRQLLEQAGPPPARRGTVAENAAAYLETMPEGRARENARTELEPWVVQFGDRASGDLKPLEIRQQRAKWQIKGPRGTKDDPRPFSPKHLNNMLHRLRAMYAATHEDLNPAAQVKVLRVRYDDERAIPDRLIDLIIDGMSDTAWPVSTKPGKQAPPPNLAKLRLRVMRYSGLSQAMVKRVEERHLDFKKKTIYVTVRLKGAGVEGGTLRMLNKAVDAWRALADADGLGDFSTRSLAHAWRRAVNRARRAWADQEAGKRRPQPWPLHDDDRAYDLRHSFGTWALTETGDLEATAELMRHKNINTTRRYTKGAAKVRAARAVAVMNKSRGN